MEKDYVLQGTSLYVYLPEEVDHESGERTKRQMESIMSEHYVRTIVFDFTKTVFMDSSGIGMLMGRYRALGMRKDCVTVTGANERIRKILLLSGMNKIISIGEP